MTSNYIRFAYNWRAMLHTINGASLSRIARWSCEICFCWSYISWLVLAKWDCRLLWAVVVSATRCCSAVFDVFQELHISFAHWVMVLSTVPRSLIDWERAPKQTIENAQPHKSIWGFNWLCVYRKISNELTLWILNVAIWVRCPSIWYTNIRVKFINSPIDVDVARGVAHLKLTGCRMKYLD